MNKLTYYDKKSMVLYVGRKGDFQSQKTKVIIPIPDGWNEIENDYDGVKLLLPEGTPLPGDITSFSRLMASSSVIMIKTELANIEDIENIVINSSPQRDISLLNFYHTMGPQGDQLLNMFHLPTADLAVIEIEDGKKISFVTTGTSIPNIERTGFIGLGRGGYYRVDRGISLFQLCLKVNRITDMTTSYAEQEKAEAYAIAREWMKSIKVENYNSLSFTHYDTFFITGGIGGRMPGIHYEKEGDVRGQEIFLDGLVSGARDFEDNDYDYDEEPEETDELTTKLPEYRIEKKGKTTRLILLPTEEIPKSYQIRNWPEFDELVISDGVATIDTNSFSFNEHLKKLTISGDFTVIPENAFYGCENLETVVIKEGVTTIGKSAFRSCKNITRIELPSTLEVIEDEAFEYCETIKLFVIPDGVHTIGKKALSPVYGEARAFLPGSLKKIEEQDSSVRLFAEASSPVAKKKTSKLMKSIKENQMYSRANGVVPGIAVADGVFDGAIFSGAGYDFQTKIQTKNYIDVPEGIETIGEFAFAHIEGDWMDDPINAVLLPSSLREIKPYAFAGNTELRIVTFKEGTVRIGEKAFMGCPIRVVELPKTIEYIADDAFDKDVVLIVDGCYVDDYLREKPKNKEAYQKRADIEKQIEEIEDQILYNRKQWETKQQAITEADNAISLREKSIAIEIQNYESIQTEYDHVQNEWDEKKKINSEELKRLVQKKDAVLEEIAALEKERSETFFLNFSKKSSLMKQIEEKRVDLYKVEKELEAKKVSCKKKIDDLVAKNEQDKFIIKASNTWIQTLDLALSQLEENKRTKQEEHDNIVISPIDNEAIRVPERTLLQYQKQLLVDSLYVPRLTEEEFPEFDAIFCGNGEAGKSKETKFLELLFKNYKTVTKWVITVWEGSAFWDNGPKYKAIKEINRKLLLEETDSIENYVCRYTSEFYAYCEKRVNSPTWKNLRKNLEKYYAEELKHTPASYLEDLPTSFYMILKVKDDHEDCLLFPFGIVTLTKSGYYEFVGVPFTNAKIQCISEERETFKVSEESEIVSSRYEHQNKDGSPNNRYKNNRAIYTVREWSIRIGQKFEVEDDYIHFEVANEKQANEIIVLLKELFTLGGVDDINDATGENAIEEVAEEELCEPIIANQSPNVAQIAVGETIEFGSYPQVKDCKDTKQPIKWRVLKKEKDRALLISESILESMPYEENPSGKTWKDCSLRAWLNGEFFDNAFSAAEQKRIALSKVVADFIASPLSQSEKGTVTEDKVFLLSVPEIGKYFPDEKDRKCEYSQEARAKADALDNGWWLRSPGIVPDRKARVENGDGKVYNLLCTLSYGVRPVIWIEDI